MLSAKSYAYPKRTSNQKNSNVEFYYCADSPDPNKKVSNDPVKYRHGTILDKDKNPILFPSYFVTYNKLTGDNIKKYHIVDCTVVNFYFQCGVWMMGTRNSWNISDICEFNNTTNQILFEEVIEKKGYTIDFNAMDKTKIHTFAFSNPKCHFLSNDHVIWSYDPNHEFVDAPEDMKDETNYVALNPTSGELGIQQSQLWKDITNKMYTNRISIIEQESNYEVAVAKILLRVMHDPVHSYREICDFFEKHLNDTCKEIFKIVKQTVEDLDVHFRQTIREFEGLNVPRIFLEGLDEYSGITKCHDKATKNFVVKVIAQRLEKANLSGKVE